jgi:hypothetical protein
LVPPEAIAHHRLALGDQATIPETSVLVGEPKECALGSGASRPASLDELHQSEQADRLGFVGHQLNEHAAEPDGLRATREWAACLRLAPTRGQGRW